MIDIKNAKRIVFKFGTNVLRGNDGSISLSRIYSFIEDISKLHKQGKEIIIVTSGAVGLGANKANVDTTGDVILKQACAAIGQTSLMSIYEHGFDKYKITCAQILLTEEDFTQRVKYLSLSNVLNKLLELKIIPIINQNDTVSTTELEEACGVIEVCFSDNDKLSALVASKLEADLLVIMSDIDGLFDKNPKENKDAKKIPIVKEVTPEIEKMGQKASKGGRGGMKTKLEAAKVVTRSGGHVIIANGKTPNILTKIFTEDDIGTIFLPIEQLSGKKRWIGYATSISGKIKVNNGAKKALKEKDSSLLSIGVLNIEGEFQKGEVVSIVDEQNIEFAKGMVNYGSSDCKKIIGVHSDKIIEILGYKNYDAIITRDNIVIL
jgi:glutamate 5-kinase